MDDKGGIQMLLAAEQDAQRIVANARSGMLRGLEFCDLARKLDLVFCAQIVLDLVDRWNFDLLRGVR